MSNDSVVRMKAMPRLAAASLCWIALAVAPLPSAGTPSNRWESAIQKFEQADKQHPPPRGAVLFVGSSSIRRWDLKRWLPDLQTINRGFGGSQIADSVHFADRIIIPYHPRVIVVYAGDNDIAAGKSPERVRDDFRALVRKVRRGLPDTPILFIAIKPSLKRWSMWEKMREANQLIAQFCEADKSLRFVDITAPMLDAEGRPRPELFAPDGLHLSDAGYRLWTSLLSPLLANGGAAAQDSPN